MIKGNSRGFAQQTYGMKVIEEARGDAARDAFLTTMILGGSVQSFAASICDLHCATGWRKRWIRNRGKVFLCLSIFLRRKLAWIRSLGRRNLVLYFRRLVLVNLTVYTRAPFLRRIGQRTVLVIVVGKNCKSSLDPYERKYTGASEGGREKKRIYDRLR